MEAPVTKSRTPSRCREWERNRRNKFNDAISRLGEIVKEIHRANSGAKDVENVQYPKVEIVEKAIICLTTFVEEKAQLKAELLALQVKVDADKKQTQSKKDVSTQVFIGINKKSKNDKYVKVVMLRKSKRKVLEEKAILTSNTSANVSVESKKSASKDVKQKVLPKLPVLLPKANSNGKKGPESTIVVLPAAPYMFPQRPLLLPTVRPAFVLVDQNLQSLNRQSFPLVNKSNSDITKTTMVNILPISAYSRPLSAIKSKKTKSKVDICKKVKKSKQEIKSKEPHVTTDTSTIKSNDVELENSVKESKEKSKSQDNQPQKKQEENQDSCITSKVEVNSSVVTFVTSSQVNTVKNDTSTCTPKSISNIAVTEHEKTKAIKVVETTKITPLPKYTDRIKNVERPTDKNPDKKVNDTPQENGKNCNKVPNQKEHVMDKEKENKLPNILDTALCESAVDGGNARLELAEEFLAASPTAAFLMSFPLVSGNRADSPAEETANSIPISTKDNNQSRSDMINSHTLPYFDKPNSGDIKSNPMEKSIIPNNTVNKQNEQQKYITTNVTCKDVIKPPNIIVTSNTTNENPFLNLSMSSLLPSSCTLSDTTFGLDFDCNISKSVPNQSSSYASNSNFFYKSDPFSTVKSTIYSTSSISSGHEFNSFGLYPCAMEKYATKNKPDYSNVEDSLMKIGTSRLTYDIDLGWSHKGFDFVSCTSASNTFNKDNALTSGSASGSYSSSYNPFTPEFHVPLVSNANKKENSGSKATASYPDSIASFYSQPTNLWSEEVPFYTNNNASKSLTSRHQNYFPVEQAQINQKLNSSKHYETKQAGSVNGENVTKPTHSGTTQQVQEKYKKSPSKMHINWMTSEVRPMHTNCKPIQTEVKSNHKPTYSQLDQNIKKQDVNEHNYFPISMHNFTSQPVQEDSQVWPSVRPAGTTEISIEPPPINLPTLVGDLALGPHDKKKSIDVLNRGPTQTDIQNCSNFFSVTQLMNRSTDNTIPIRYQGATNSAIESQNQKAIQVKQNMSQTTSDQNRKPMSNAESHIPQPCYTFNDTKAVNSYENMNQFSHNKTKASKSDKNSKAQKNSYSAESLIRGGTCNQKIPDNTSNSTKFIIPSQKYNDFNIQQDSSVAQVSHFPPILDYTDNAYSGQQFSGTNLYNTTTNTISNSFYSNFMSGSSNLMPGNYTSGPFSGEFIDYNQTSECSYPNHKYTELKMRNQSTVFQQEKATTNFKSTRRESAAKHKLECSKKDSNKKCQSKRTKLNNEVDEWNDTSHLLWQNKTTSKRHGTLMSEEIAFPNYMGNQMAAAAAAGQYQPEFFNSHIMSSNMQPVGHNVDRSLANFPGTSRANFNLSTIFPEITMKVQ